VVGDVLGCSAEELSRQSRSMTPAIACPKPMHIEAMP
jgi:hypothetical protein